MAIITNTYTNIDSKRNRETFADLIAMITPEETPLSSMIGKQKVEGVHPEWSTDSLAAPVTTNAQVEGDEFTFSAVTATNRVGNYTQIFRKSFIVSDTQEVVSKAGPKSDLGRQRAKTGVELKKDVEASILSNTASVAGATNTTARKLGGLASWLATNTDRGATASNGGFSSGTGLTVAAGNGTQRAFTKTILDNIIQQAYQSGGNPTAFICSPYAKTVFSTFMSNSNVAAFRTAMKGKEQGTIYGAADQYVSDFGVIDIVPNRVMAAVGAVSARNGFLVDPDMLALGTLRAIKEVEPAKTGDATKKVLLTELTLVVKNEAACAVASDLFGMTSAT
jgi:hypothetical protein